MLEKLQEFMETRCNYTVTDYAHFEVPYKKSLGVPIGLGLFGATVLVYILDLILSWDRFGFYLVLIAFVIFVLAPFATKKGNKYLAIIVTPEYLIQRKSLNEFEAIKFDNVTSFKLTEGGILIKGEQATIVLGLSMFREEIDPIIDILEAKGKTFDPEKDYMIRPVEIVIKDNKITLIDVQDVSDFDLFYQKYSSSYAMLTPGYIETINFRNSVITSFSHKDDGTITIGFNQLEVKEGHPENTKFESIIALNCGVIFHKAKIKRATMKNLHDAAEEEQNLANDDTAITAQLDNAVVAEWKTKKSSIDFVLAAGVHRLTLNISHQNVMVGWNKTKE